MRILLRVRRLWRQRRPGERGAIAVVVAVLTPVIFGIGAYTVDFGVAYVNTRQLQQASDASALAAARHYASLPGTCAQMMTAASSSGEDVVAQNDADALRLDNRPGSTRSGYSVACSGGQLNVTYSSRRSTPSFLGGLFGRSSAYDVSRSATASVSVSPSGHGRPYALCSNGLPSVSPPTPAAVTKLSLPDPSNPAAVANCTTPGGNWWTVRCPGVTSSGMLGTETANGCDIPISVVPNQPAAATPASLSAFLSGACPSITTANRSMCLGTDTGNIRGTPIIDQWSTFVDNQTTIVVPVFCGQPDCTPPGLNTSGGGGGTIYPVYKLAAIRICGYHWGNSGVKDNLTGPCANNPGGYSAAAGTSTDNFLLVEATAVAASGDTSALICSLGSSCDGGVRRVLLTQ